MKARFGGECPYCKKKIEAGENIVKAQKGWCHYGCRLKDPTYGLSGEDAIYAATMDNAWHDRKAGLITEEELIDIERRCDDY